MSFNKTILLCSAACAVGLMPHAASAQDNGVTVPEQASDNDAIVVTARLRDETLMDVPVAITALNSEALDRYDASSLTDIGSLVPNVIISNYRINGGGSLSIRGISSPATQIGFEQPVSVSIDGVQTSAGRVATLGFFDLQRVEVLRGPQALFFGKNSPAGVISMVSEGPTDALEVGGKLGYEFEGREVFAEGYISGPISDTLGARLALRYRKMNGWLHNNAKPLDNPYFGPGLPADLATLPGGATSTIGEEELMGRLTLAFEPTDDFKATLKVFGYTSDDEGAGASAQNTGPCPADGLPRSFGIADPYGDCKADDQTSYGAIPDTVAATIPRNSGSGTPYGDMEAWVASLDMRYNFNDLMLTSISGYVTHKYKYLSSLDQTIYNGLIALEDNTLESFSQELRLNSDFDGKFNFLVGGYYQHNTDDLFNYIAVRPYVIFPIANNGHYEVYQKEGKLTSDTYSVFGQVIFDITDQLELSGGVRYTHEKRKTTQQNLYGFGPFATQNTLFPGSSDPTAGILAGKFSDDNISPEITLTYKPSHELTTWIAYKTGFKSGGFALTSPLQTIATLGDIDFDSETVQGIEAGMRADLLGGRLTFSANAFAYDFKDLQATVYDAANVRFLINNAGKVKQRGFEADFNYQASDSLSFHGALAYVHNRFRNYEGACYSFGFPAGSDPATAMAPSGCEFVDPGNSLTLQQDFGGRAPARSPDLTGSFGAIFETPITNDLMITLTGDAFYSDNYNASDGLSPGSAQDSFWRFNASAAVGKIDDQWKVSLIGRNLGNEHYVLFATDRTGGASLPGPGEQRAAVARGREVSLQLSFQF